MIKNNYKKFILFIFGHCKSTGTLIALGADEIMMGPFGELGPLDIQLAKDDELINTSGLSYSQSLLHLNQQLFSFFENNFISLKRDFGYSITTRTASEISSKLSIGIISPIAQHIDPIKLGEVQRAMSIARAYGKRICKDEDLIQKLIGGYPSHSFVIDFKEAESLFKNKCVVRLPNEDETLFEKEFPLLFRSEALPQPKPLVDYFNWDENMDKDSPESTTATPPQENSPESTTATPSEEKASESTTANTPQENL